MRSEEQARDSLPMSCYGKWTVQTSRRAEYGAEDEGRYRAHPPSRDEARAVLEAGESGARALSEADAALPEDAGNDLVPLKLGSATLWQDFLDDFSLALCFMRV